MFCRIRALLLSEALSGFQPAESRARLHLSQLSRDLPGVLIAGAALMGVGVVIASFLWRSLSMSLVGVEWIVSHRLNAIMYVVGHYTATPYFN